MKAKTLKLILYSLILSLGLALHLAHAHAETTAEEIKNNTAIVTDYFKKLRANCGFSAEEFEQMHDALLQTPAELINPVSKDQSFLRQSQCNVYWKTFEQIREEIASHPDKVDYKVMANYLADVIIKIKENEGRREEAHVDTKNLLIEMDFVVIPQDRLEKKYFSESIVPVYSHRQEIMATPVEIQFQTTSVTQYQWAKVMDDNPSRFNEGEDCGEVEVNGKKIQMCPNRPVENISYQESSMFIQKLNDQDLDYSYMPPSIHEYLAVIGENQKIYGTNCQKQDKTCRVGHTSYHYVGTKRVYSLLDNTKEFTRSYLEKSNLPKFLQEKTVYLLFGNSYHMDNFKTIDMLPSMTRYLLYSDTLSDDLSFRLIRIKKGFFPQQKDVRYNYEWEESLLSQDKSYIKDKTTGAYIHRAEYLDFMVKYKHLFSEEIQHTINVLLQTYGYNPQRIQLLKEINLFARRIFDVSPLAGLIDLERLALRENQISDLKPLAGLANLERLDLADNKISDISSLAGLTNLKWLDLRDNKISDYASLANLKKSGCEIEK